MKKDIVEVSKELNNLKIERQIILNKRPELQFIGDFTPEGNRLFEIDERIKEIQNGLA